jgi:flagellin-like protein
VARRKGISPVIATVIIVAVTIAVAIAVAFWMTGIIGLFTGAVEKIEFVSLYAQATDGGWTLTAILRNVGTTTTSFDVCFINGVPNTQWGGAAQITGVAVDNQQQQAALPVRLNPGQSATITITLTRGQNIGTTTLNPGVSIEVKFHTTGGKEYPKLTTLP